MVNEADDGSAPCPNGTPHIDSAPNPARAATTRLGGGLSVVGVPREDYGDDHSKHVIEQYKLFVDTTEKVSTRRATANSFFLTLNTGLVGALTIALRGSELKASPLFVVIGVIGVATCFYWRRLLRSFKDLNSAKFRVIDMMEEHLPVRPYRLEWRFLGEGKDETKYHEATQIEMAVPIIFAIVHVLLFLWAAAVLVRSS